MANYNLLSERSRIIREVAEEGIVLIKNEENMLPFGKETVAVFGRTQVDTIKCGTGSAYCESEYMIDILTGLENAGISVDRPLAEKYRRWAEENSIASFGVWGNGSHVNPEMPISAEEIEAVSRRAEKAIIVIGRTAGENDDVMPIEGDYLLSADEKALVENVCRYFDKVLVVANVGNLIGYDFTERREIRALVLLHLPGMEGGNALGNVLSGKVSPSGKLTDTIATVYADYPSSAYFGKKSGIEQNYYEDIFVGYRYFETFETAKNRVLYPFGHGLSYTDFDLKCTSFDCENGVNGTLSAVISVKNTGKYAGKEVVMLYSTAPSGALGAPKYELRAFAKTKLLAPGEEERLTLCLKLSDLASFDDTGVLGTPNAWVLMKGAYTVSLGNNVRTLTPIGTFENPETLVVKTCVPMATQLEKRLLANGEYEKLNTIPRDPSLGIFIDPMQKNVIEAEEYYEKDETCVTYRVEITAAGIYTVRFEGEMMEVSLNGRPLPAHHEYYGENGFDTVIPLGVQSFTFAGEKGARITLTKNDSPALIVAEGESYVEGGKYAECGLWVTNHPFTDDGGDIKFGRALTRMHSEGRYALYKLDVEKAGVYDVRLRYSSTRAERLLSDTFSFLVSNVTQDIEPVTLKHTTDEAGTFVFETSAPIRLALPKGEAFLKIVSKTSESPITAYLIFTPSDRGMYTAEETAADVTTVSEDTANGTVIPRRPLAEVMGEYDFRRVLDGTLSMDAFVDSLTDEELSLLTCGNGNGHIGYMPERGIPEAYWSDGPVGLRQPFRVSVYPSSTMVAATWNMELAREYARAIATEANLYNVDIWLAPAMNIHRDPCCGRNFEYYSEDPYLSGMISSAMTEGAKEFDVATTIKHFAANSTEYLRMKSNSRLSARAFREIYARGFEISIRECEPWALMTSYNHINGIKVCEDPVICEDILRRELGFTGTLITDYGNDSVHVKELSAGHDLKMHFGDPKSVEAAMGDGTLAREKVKRSVKYILEMIARTAGKRM